MSNVPVDVVLYTSCLGLAFASLVVHVVASCFGRQVLNSPPLLTMCGVLCTCIATIDFVLAGLVNSISHATIYFVLGIVFALFALSNFLRLRRKPAAV